MTVRAALCNLCLHGEVLIPRTPSESETAWLAGLLEGEGSFMRAGQKAQVSATSTDLDVIERLRAISGVGYIYEARPSKAHHKMAWVWAVRRHDHIRHVVALVLPWLAARRTQAALALLDRIGRSPEADSNGQPSR